TPTCCGRSCVPTTVTRSWCAPTLRSADRQHRDSSGTELFGMLPNVEDLAGAVVTIASLARGLERVLPDMTLAQYRILTMIGNSPQRAGRLAGRATMSNSALTGLLDGVTSRGWVLFLEIEGAPRGVVLQLTDAGV